MMKKASLVCAFICMTAFSLPSQAAWVKTKAMTPGPFIPYIKCWWVNTTNGQGKITEGWFSCPNP